MGKEDIEKLFDPSRPHRMLTLDGGGIRGALTLEVLVKMEKMLAQIPTKDGASR